MSTFSLIKANTRRNLNDINPKSYSVSDIDDSFQDAYDDIISRTQCLIKKTTLNWAADLSYYDFRSLVSDYMAVVAIFNNVNRRWLEDDKNTRNFDQMRIDWEIANGSPTNWTALNFKYTAVFPRYASAAGTFDLYYWATAPVIVDAATPLIATDMQHLLEEYSTEDLLEQFEEYVSAAPFWELYEENLEIYRERVKNLTKTDLLLLI